MAGSDTLDPRIFVNGLEHLEGVPKGAPKLFHKKSRTGCSLCRTRRVKCNEAKPICSNCKRLNQNCVYDRQKSTRESAPKAPKPVNDPVESRARRLQELQLFHRYVTRTAPSIAVDESSRQLWVDIIPAYAFKSDALLYAVLAVTALHSAKTGVDNEIRALGTHELYLDMALREHHREISQMSEQTVDAVCLTSSVLRICAFVILQERVLEPYAPPTQWLRMTGGSSSLFRKAWELRGKDTDSVAYRMIQGVKDDIVEDARNAADKRAELVHLLERRPCDELSEPWDDQIRDAYEQAITIIGGAWLAMRRGGSPGEVRRKLVIFPMLVPPRFTELVEEERPRALVVLAHYFALLSTLRRFWFVGDTGAREVASIVKVLSEEWLDRLKWPLGILEKDIVLA